MSHRQLSPETDSRTSFSVRAVSPLDLAILACGGLAFVFSFMSYYTFLMFSASAWHGFFGWFAALAALAASAVLAASLFVPRLTRVSLPQRPITLAGFGVATLCVILAGLVDPNGATDLRRGAGYYLSLVVILAGLALSYLRTSRRLPWQGGYPSTRD